jgi:hypothetical protein
MPAATPAPAAVLVAAPAAARRAPVRGHAALAAAVAPSDDLRVEIALIDAARDALAAAAPGQALEALRRYGARFPDGTFAPEAVALRVEALEKSGSHREAQAAARRFLAAHPESPLRDRIERICGDGAAAGLR